MSEKITKTATDFINSASGYIGRYFAERFREDQFCCIDELEMQSPLEHVLYTALHVVVELNNVPLSEPLRDCCGPGVHIWPQEKIGPYRVDFSVTRYCYNRGDWESTYEFRKVIVECDGTAFHERTEEERRKEKLRDRYMQKLGLKVFRYTGKEILSDPYKIAVEIIGYVMDDEQDTLTPDQYFE